MLGVISGMAFSAAMLSRKAGLNGWPDAAMGNTIGGAAALVAYLPFALAKGEVAGITRAPWKGVSAFLLAGAFSALAQLATFLSLRVTMAATTQVITALEPLFTMMLSMLILQRSEVLSRSLIGSTTLVCAGVILMTL
ncbi:MAG TPA: EamA family transporter [Symbiobacteriaceae bacterium]|nr:EamA family transporter [Symbiobacteriaceae bacterium]